MESRKTGPRDTVNLLRGWPASSILPSSQVSSCTKSLLAQESQAASILEYGPDLGFPPLRQSLAEWLSAHHGAHAPDPERICITGGASQNVARICQSFSDPGVTRCVWLVRPVYFLACGIFEDAGFAGRLKGVPEGEGGVDVAWLEKEMEAEDGKTFNRKPCKPSDPKRKIYRHLIYCVPTRSNPSGKVMSLDERKKVVLLARKHDALVICDDVYDMLQWRVPSAEEMKQPETQAAPVTVPQQCRLPRLVDVDISLGPPKAAAETATTQEDDEQPTWFGNVVSNGTFSKLVSPGVRTGWVEATTPAFALGLSRTGSTISGGCPSQLCAGMIWEMLSSGMLDRHLEYVVRPALRWNHAVMMRALGELAFSAGWKLWLWRHGPPDHGDRTFNNNDNKSYASSSSSSCFSSNDEFYGGYFVWIELPAGVSADEVTAEAKKEENLIVAPGNVFRVRGDEQAADFDRFIRLCFAWESAGKIREGVERLARVLERLRGIKS